MQYSSGQPVITQGSSGKELFIVESGEYQVTTNRTGDQVRTLWHWATMVIVAAVVLLAAAWLLCAPLSPLPNLPNHSAHPN